MEDMEGLGSLPNGSIKDCEGNQWKKRLLGQKLSLKSERSEKNTETGNQDPVASHLPSTASSTYPTAYISDVSGKQNAISENMCINASIGVVSKKECEGNGKNLQLPGQRLSITSVCEGSRKNLQLPGQKGLPVTSVASSQRSNDNDMLPNHPPTSVSSSRDCAMQPSDAAAENSLARSIGGSSDSLNKPLGGNRRIIRTLGLKLSLKSVKSEKKSDDQKENMVANYMPSHSSFNNLQKRPMEDVSVKNFDEAATPIPLNSGTKNQQPNSQLLSNNNPNEGRKKLCLLSKRLSLKPKLPETDKTCDQESKRPAYAQSDDREQPNELPLSAPVLKTEAVASTELPLFAPAFESHQTMALGSAGSQEDVNPSNCSKQSPNATESMVVSDSEDSTDECEKPPSRSRLSLMRRRLAGKLRN
jgi:ubiquitin-conjugating enzyme E2 T